MVNCGDHFCQCNDVITSPTLLQTVKQTYITLDEKLFQHYVEEKFNPIVGVLEQHMYAGQFDWSMCLSCQGVRRYVKEALMGMIEVHSEVCV